MAIPAALVDLLAAHLAARGLDGGDGDAYLFVGRDGQPIRYRTFWWQWQRAIERAGVEAFGFHQLRVLSATLLVAAGVDPRTVASRLGHSTVATTLNIYAKRVHEADRAAADLLADTLSRTSRGHSRPDRRRHLR